MTISHGNHDLEVELREVHGRLLAMGARCEQALRDAVEAFVGRDPTRVAEVIRRDERIDRDEVELDELALRVLARRQHVAHDLRFLTVVLRSVSDLERIGDKAVSIAAQVKQAAEAPVMPPHPEVAAMSGLAQAMLRGALDALVAGDVDRAERVLAHDPEVDRLHGQMQDQVCTWVRGHPDDISAGLAVLSVGRYLERVVDHATNLAEQVVSLVRGGGRRALPAMTVRDGAGQPQDVAGTLNGDG
jgi:phosphate transport system protein